MPRFSIALIIVLLIVYIIGARYPMLAQKIGAA
jgi:hypothetical protein